MLIGIDASKTAGERKTGIDNTAYQIILGLSKIDHKNTYNLYTHKSLDPALLENKNFKERCIPFPKFWNKFRLPLALLKDRPKKFLELTYAIPPYAPKKTAVFLHDFAFKIFPEAYSSYELFLQETAVKTAIKKAKKILLSGKANADDFCRFYKVNEKKLEIVPLSYNDKVFKKIEKPRNILKLDSPYLLSVGRLETRKNTAGIIEAFCKFKKENYSKLKLVLVGNEGFGYEQIEAKLKEYEEFNNDIILAGYTGENDLAHLYAKAEAFIYPSLYEGFGLPILEAMACLTPVITSATPTIEETAGNAAILVDPLDTDQIAQKIKLITSDKKLRALLIKKGEERIKKFSWAQTSQRIFDIIDTM